MAAIANSLVPFVERTAFKKTFWPFAALPPSRRGRETPVQVLEGIWLKNDRADEIREGTHVGGGKSVFPPMRSENAVSKERKRGLIASPVIWTQAR